MSELPFIIERLRSGGWRAIIRPKLDCLNSGAANWRVIECVMAAPRGVLVAEKGGAKTNSPCTTIAWRAALTSIALEGTKLSDLY